MQILQRSRTALTVRPGKSHCPLRKAFMSGALTSDTQVVTSVMYDLERE